MHADNNYWTKRNLTSRRGAIGGERTRVRRTGCRPRQSPTQIRPPSSDGQLTESEART